MSDITRTEPDVVHGDELCIRDPGGEGRASLPSTDPDHTPAGDPDASDRMLAPVADALLAAADLHAGDAVLDIGSGCGATTFLAADVVGPAGSVTGVDVTPQMLDIARARLAASGRTNVAFVAADAQTDAMPSGVDVAISRFGTMFFDDPVAAFVNIGDALRPGGKLCMATWQPLEANAWLVIPGAALLQWITLPDVGGGGPGMFAQSDPVVVTATLEVAGYTDIAVEPAKLALTLGVDPGEAFARLADTGVGRAALDAVPAEHRPAARAAVEAALADHADEQGVRLGAAVWIITASRP